MAQLNYRQPVIQNYGVVGSHSRSSSQPAFFSNHSLPPLSPLPQSESSLASSSTVKDVVTDDVDVSSRGPLPVSSSFTYENGFQGNFDCLPPRISHRRSSSDVPLGFDAMIQTSPQLVPISGHAVGGKAAHVNDKFGMAMPYHFQKREMGTVSDYKCNANGKVEGRFEGEVVDDFFQPYMLHRAGTEDRDKGSQLCGTKKSGCEITETESISKRNISGMEGTGLAEGNNKRGSSEVIGTVGHHFRSLSVDSAFRSLHFNEEPPKLAAAGSRACQLSPSNSVTENMTKFSLEFGNGEFSEGELKKIMADERLAEIAVSDPKRVKRVLANRQSAARSKERKLRYISELEHTVKALQIEATTLSAKLTVLQKDFTEVTNQNNELKFRLQAMEQQARLRDALHEALAAEVQHLKLAAAELGEDDGSSSCVIQQHLPSKHHHMHQMQHRQSSQLQQLSIAASKNATTASATTPTSA